MARHALVSDGVVTDCREMVVLKNAWLVVKLRGRLKVLPALVVVLMFFLIF
jgi:hypothetical protein